jgi:4-aminobutyrate aminotransferase
LRQICNEHGVLLVLDEVQSGFGRTGKNFACEHWGIDGDIMCLAKGIANGLPLGAIVARASVMDWPSGSHASTFGGNPVACAAALETLRLIARRYRSNAEVRGAQLRAGLQALGGRFSCVREVRGKGLMIGLEIQDRSGKPSPLLRDRIVDLSFHRGLLLLPCGPSTVRFCPPLCLTGRQVEIGLELFTAALAAAAEPDLCSAPAPIQSERENCATVLEDEIAEPDDLANAIV